MEKQKDAQIISKVQDYLRDAPSVQSNCGCRPSSCCGAPEDIGASDYAGFQVKAGEDTSNKKILNVELLAIDLNTCDRCSPTRDQLRTAVRLLTPVAEALGIELRLREIVVQTPEQAKELGLLSSPTIRLNGRDIAEDIRESACRSCGELTASNTVINCREWHYRGHVYFSAPLPMLIEAIMNAMLNIDQPPVVPQPLKELPENLQRYFNDRKQPRAKCC
ncbi:MAG: DUF2703 domain-containing protein [Thermodesulforhabdaceae bacterium]|jgi:hypothetical protein